MKKIGKIAAILLFAVPAFAQEATQVSASGQIRVSAQEIETNYCKNQDDLFTVYNKVRVTFSNASNGPVIIRKDALGVWKIRVAKSVADTVKGNFVYNPDPYEVSGTKPQRSAFDSRPDAVRFVVLNSGESFSTDLWAGFLANLETKSPESAPTSGHDYVMQLYIRTWPSLTAGPVASSVAKGWQKWGQLQSDVIQSPFIALHVPELGDSEACKGFSEKHGIR